MNFGTTIALAVVIGAVVAGQTFYLFTVENLTQFGALKAIGVSNRRLVGMILLQAVVAGGIGYGIGMGRAAALLESTITYSTSSRRRARAPSTSSSSWTSPKPTRSPWTSSRRAVIIVA